MAIERRRSTVAGLVIGMLLAGCAGTEPERVTTRRIDPVVTGAEQSVPVISDRPAPATLLPATTPPEQQTADPTSTVVATDRTGAPPRVNTPARAADEATRVSVPATTTRYVVPVADPSRAGWSPTHASYRATDIFVAGGCGGTIVSPVDGVVLEVRTVDAWDPAVDDPATRGGRTVAVRGYDGVRYYMAHFETIHDSAVVGAQIASGTPLGTVGTTGRSSACHVHFGISPPCAEPEWSVRRGVIWPYPYLDAWKQGEQLSPAPEIEAWVAANPGACSLAARSIEDDDTLEGR